MQLETGDVARMVTPGVAVMGPPDGGIERSRCREDAQVLASCRMRARDALAPVAATKGGTTVRVERRESSWWR